MNVNDGQMVLELEARDGPLGSRWRRHRVEDACPYPDLYPDGNCPWCAAELRRDASGVPPAPQRRA